jgi:hypothetical protein
MARPWKKQWPRVGKRGKKSYVIGFYDHERIERTRHFPSPKSGQDWMVDYSNAERRGAHSLRRFLLDLDASEACEAEERTLGQVVELYFALDADPTLEDGLAPSTFETYRNVANGHILGLPMHNRKHEVIGSARHAVALSAQPASSFNGPDAPRRWREEMRLAGVSQQRRIHAWRVLSSALSWAAGSHMIPEIRTNGCLLANERTLTRRRSARRGGTGIAASGRRRRSLLPSWALSPQAIEAIRRQMLKRVESRDPILAARDAIVASLQYGLGARNQEVWGLRWMSIGDSFADIVEVISWGQLDEWGKTEHSAERRTSAPGILLEDLQHWRTMLRAAGHPARDVDFIVPGDLAGSQHGITDPNTGAVHFSGNQAEKWGPKFFKPAVAKAAKERSLQNILGATPYSMRRGGISLRLRAEDAQTVASECGTSLQMLDRHYAFAIDDLRRFGPRPIDVEWRAARRE